MPAYKRSRKASRFSPYGSGKKLSRRRGKMTAPKVRAIVRKQVARSDSKFIQINSPLGVGGYTHSSDTNKSLVEIAQGESSGQRVGVKARITGIYIKLRMHLDPHSPNQHPATFRVRLDHVKTNVRDATTGVSALGYFDKPDYVDITKKALWDKTFNFRTSGDGDMSGNFVIFQKFIRLKNHWCRWSSSSEPDTGNIILAAYMESSSGTQALFVESQVRTYFSEV